MKTFSQFLEEAKRIRMTRYYHGTPESSADKIHKSGFKGSEVHASTSARTADALAKDMEKTQEPSQFVFLPNQKM